jgi:hypothetical protein
MTFNDWKEKNTLSKIITIIGLLLTISIVILALLQIFNVWDKAGNAVQPLLGVFILLYAIENWKTNRIVALVLLFVAIIIFVSAIQVLFR